MHLCLKNSDCNYYRQMVIIITQYIQRQREVATFSNLVVVVLS